MTKDKTIRVYNYIDHPYETVRRKLSIEALEAFRRSAIEVAALSVRPFAPERYVNFPRIEVGTDISVAVKTVEDEPQTVLLPQRTRIRLEWQSAGVPRLFPFMRAEFCVYPLTATATRLDLSGSYEPPFGVAGSVIDSVLGHRVAESLVHQFIRDIAVYLRTELSKAG